MELPGNPGADQGHRNQHSQEISHVFRIAREEVSVKLSFWGTKTDTTQDASGGRAREPRGLFYGLENVVDGVSKIVLQLVAEFHRIIELAFGRFLAFHTR